MKTRLCIISTLLLIVHFTIYSQKVDTTYFTYVSVEMYEISHSSIKKEINPKIENYEGSYHFGESEGESQLEILCSNGKLFARTVYGEWSENAHGWIGREERLRIIYSDGLVWIDEYLYSLYNCIKTTPLTLNEGTKGLVAIVINDIGENSVSCAEQFNPNTEDIKKQMGTIQKRAL